VSGNPEAGLVGITTPWSCTPQRAAAFRIARRSSPAAAPGRNAAVTACEIPVYPSRPRVRVTKAYR
jgi:hypothetical protein